MKLAIICVALVASSSCVTVAWASGLDLVTVASWPWWEIGLIAGPILGIAIQRLTFD